MAETKTMNVRFQQKIDTAANWAESDLILLAGEIAIESDTGKFKFGVGGKTFKELDYAGIDQAQLDATNDNFYEVLPGSTAENVYKSLDEIQNPKKGDIAVVKEIIGEISTASSMTAYMYDGENWCALDGTMVNPKKLFSSGSVIFWKRLSKNIGDKKFCWYPMAEFCNGFFLTLPVQ